jgi:hypothetical protein
MLPGSGVGCTAVLQEQIFLPVRISLRAAARDGCRSRRSRATRLMVIIRTARLAAGGLPAAAMA